MEDIEQQINEYEQLLREATDARIKAEHRERCLTTELTKLKVQQKSSLFDNAKMGDMYLTFGLWDAVYIGKEQYVDKIVHVLCCTSPGGSHYMVKVDIYGMNVEHTCCLNLRERQAYNILRKK